MVSRDWKEREIGNFNWYRVFSFVEWKNFYRFVAQECEYSKPHITTHWKMLKIVNFVSFLWQFSFTVGDLQYCVSFRCTTSDLP